MLMISKAKPAAVGRTISNLLAAVMFFGSAATIPNTVLCTGPGGHCHLETVAGESCDEQASPSPARDSRPSDGCPKGSRDFRTSVDSHRSDNRSFVVTSSLIRALSSPIVRSAMAPAGVSLLPVPRPWQSSPSTIVLRC